MFVQNSKIHECLKLSEEVKIAQEEYALMKENVAQQNAQTLESINLFRKNVTEEMQEIHKKLSAHDYKLEQYQARIKTEEDTS